MLRVGRSSGDRHLEIASRQRESRGGGTTRRATAPNVPAPSLQRRSHPAAEACPLCETANEACPLCRARSRPPTTAAEACPPRMANILVEAPSVFRGAVRRCSEPSAELSLSTERRLDTLREGITEHADATAASSHSFSPAKPAGTAGRVRGHRRQSEPVPNMRASSPLAVQMSSPGLCTGTAGIA